eukprot:27814-Eustigmatos_ZCMA.PRE.1
MPTRGREKRLEKYIADRLFMTAQQHPIEVHFSHTIKADKRKHDSEGFGIVRLGLEHREVILPKARKPTRR